MNFRVICKYLEKNPFNLLRFNQVKCDINPTKYIFQKYLNSSDDFLQLQFWLGDYFITPTSEPKLYKQYYQKYMSALDVEGGFVPSFMLKSILIDLALSHQLISFALYNQDNLQTVFLTKNQLQLDMFYLSPNINYIVDYSKN